MLFCMSGAPLVTVCWWERTFQPIKLHDFYLRCITVLSMFISFAFFSDSSLWLTCMLVRGWNWTDRGLFSFSSSQCGTSAGGQRTTLEWMWVGLSTGMHFNVILSPYMLHLSEFGLSVSLRESLLPCTSLWTKASDKWQCKCNVN